MDKPRADDTDEPPSTGAYQTRAALGRLHLLLGALALLYGAVGLVGWWLGVDPRLLAWAGVYTVIPALALSISEVRRRRGNHQGAVVTLALSAIACGATGSLLLPEVSAPNVVGPAIASLIVTVMGAPRARRFVLWTAWTVCVLVQLVLILLPAPAELSARWAALMNGMVYATLGLISWSMLNAYIGRLDTFIARLRLTRRELRALRAALADANKGLEDKVSERTLAWQQALAEAERAADARMSFLRTMTHASRTPLHGLLGYVDLLKHSSLDPDQRTGVEQLSERAAELAYIIDDANLIEQLLNEALVERVSLVDLQWLAQGAVERLRDYAQPRAVELGVELSADVPSAAPLDSGHVRRVLDRLLRMAVQVSPGCRVQLTVLRLGDGLDPGIRFALSGQSAIAVERIQTALGSSLGAAYEAVEESCASGLIGLTIAATIVNKIGGTVRCDTRADGGFELNCDWPTSHWALQIADPGDRDADGRRRILVVEDNQMNARILELALTREGFGVDIAANGQEALEACARTAYLTILMDVNMPVMNGIEAAREIRRVLPPHRQPPILALTAVEDDAVRDECLCAGMVDILYKPISMPAVCAAVNRAVGV